MGMVCGEGGRGQTPRLRMPATPRGEEEAGQVPPQGPEGVWPPPTPSFWTSSFHNWAMIRVGCFKPLSSCTWRQQQQTAVEHR